MSIKINHFHHFNKTHVAHSYFEKGFNIQFNFQRSSRADVDFLLQVIEQNQEYLRSFFIKLSEITEKSAVTQFIGLKKGKFPSN